MLKISRWFVLERLIVSARAGFFRNRGVVRIVIFQFPAILCKIVHCEAYRGQL